MSGVLLRIYLSEGDVHDGKPCYQSLVEALLAAGVRGATVLRGIEGYGRSKQIHTARILRSSEELPLVVEAVDDEERITEVIPTLRQIAPDALITSERVEIIS